MAETPFPAQLLLDDCGRCAALCCMSHAFDAGHGFGISKQAGIGCWHLDRAGRCGIHATRAERGFTGCESYSCNGAGQRVTQEIFGGRSWQDHPALTAPMMQAFRMTRTLHDWLLLLSEAGRLPLDRRRRAERDRLILVLTPPDRLTGSWLAGAVGSSNRKALTAFLASLRGTLSDRTGSDQSR